MHQPSRIFNVSFSNTQRTLVCNINFVTEKIMNKSAPAGNVLRKQISLLPKYQLLMTPISNDKVSIQLTLLNHGHLAENMDQLTAGETHKCHIVVGDSENRILLLTCFKDKDLIDVYNGTVTYEITKKHNFEHKVFVRCISSNFVGLDVQSEYSFKGLEPLFSRGESIAYPIEQSTTKKIFKKQTTITDTFKERKRKLNDLDVSQSKEKKKRDNAVIEKFRYLKEPFGKLSIELRDKQQKPVENSSKLLQETTPSNKQVRKIINENNLQLACSDYDTTVSEHVYSEMISEDLDHGNDFLDDDHFDNILSEIENEISKSRHLSGSVNSHKPLETTLLINNPNPSSKLNYKLQNPKRPKRCNYSFIELLQRNENLSDADDTTSSTDGGFSDTIKSRIEKFIRRISTNTTNVADAAMTKLISTQTCSELSDKQVKTVELCRNDAMPHNNKIMDKDITITLKSPKNYSMVSKEPVSIEESKVDMTTEKPNVTFGTCISNNDTGQMAKGTKNKNQNDFIQENKPNKTNLLNLVIQSNDFKNVAENRTPERFVDYVNNIGEPMYFSQELLKVPCDLKKFDHPHHKIVPENCRTNNMNIAMHELEQYGNYDENEDVEMVKDKADYVVSQDSHEKYIRKDNLIQSDKHHKQLECPNNYYKLSHQLTLPNLNMTSTKTSQRNTAYTVDKLNQESISQSNKLDDVGEIKSFKETKQIIQPIPYNTFKHVNTNMLSSISEKSLQNTKDEKGDHFEQDDTMKSAISKEAPTSVSPFNQKKEKCVNTYSFSTTKIDVQTKKHADLQVQIIRKLKVDLDITEILTHEDKDVQMNKGKAAQTSYKGQTAQTSNCVDYSLSRILEIPNYSRICETSDNHVDGLGPQLAHGLHSIENMCVQEKSVKNIGQQVIQGLNEKEPAIVQGERSENFQGTEDLKGRLENILEKYSKILRKGNLERDGVTNNEYKTTNLTSKPVAQTERPYNIQDINKLDRSFPTTVINSALEVVKLTNKDDVIARLKALKQNNENVTAIKDSKTPPFILQNFQEKTTEQVAEIYEDTALDEPLPKTSNLETVDFNIDQSMFNPKTILQCLSKDGLRFIPPPIQFSDNVSTIHEAFSTPPDIEFEEIDYEYTDNIFEKKSHGVLTPTKKIETWTFSRDNECNNFDTKESCTVLPINSPITAAATRNGPQNNSKKKLGQFTYKIKDKLKI